MPISNAAAARAAHDERNAALIDIEKTRALLDEFELDAPRMTAAAALGAVKLLSGTNGVWKRSVKNRSILLNLGTYTLILIGIIVLSLVYICLNKFNL